MLMRRAAFAFAVLVCGLVSGLSTTASAQATFPASFERSRFFRPSLFSDNVEDVYRFGMGLRVAEGSLLRYYDPYRPMNTGLGYYDAITRSPYGLDASRSLYESRFYSRGTYQVLDEGTMGEWDPMRRAWIRN